MSGGSSPPRPRTGCASPTPRLGEGLREGPPAAPAEPRPRGGRVSHQQGGAPRYLFNGPVSRAGEADAGSAEGTPADARGPAVL